MRTLEIPIEDDLDEALDAVSARVGRGKAELAGDVLRRFIDQEVRLHPVETGARHPDDGRHDGRTRALESRLFGMASDGLVAVDVASLALRMWHDVSAATGCRLVAPDAAPGPDGQVLYTWDDREHHLELELLPDGRAEFFYRNRETGYLWGTDSRVGVPIPPDALAQVERFCEDAHA